MIYEFVKMIHIWSAANYCNGTKRFIIIKCYYVLPKMKLIQ